MKLPLSFPVFTVALISVVAPHAAVAARVAFEVPEAAMHQADDGIFQLARGGNDDRGGDDRSGRGGGGDDDNRGRGRGGDDNGTDDSPDDESGSGRDKPRVPGGSGCDDAGDAQEHPDCQA